MCWFLILFYSTTLAKPIPNALVSLLLWRGSSCVSAPRPGNLEQDSQINLGCACLRIDKDLLVDACDRLSVRAAALLIPTESKYEFLFFPFGGNCCDFSYAAAVSVGSATPSTRSLFAPCWCWSSHQDPVFTPTQEKFGCGKRTADGCII